MLTTRIAASAVGVLCCVLAFAEPVDYRLPPEVRPTAQSIDLKLDPSQESFSGSTVLNIEVASDVERIAIYQLGIDMHSITLRSDGVERTLAAEIGDYDINWLSDGSPIAAGEYELSI